MKIIKILLIGLVVLVALGFAGYKYLNWSFNQPCDPPNRPSSVPQNAIWAGGCDGGNWIELISVDDEKYRFRIYRDWDGELNMDADFIPTECDPVDLNKDNWQDRVAYYAQRSDSSVAIILKGTNKTCSLTSVYPAYGGDDWEVIKEKYNL